MLIGIDTGGTFTDFVFLSDDGTLAVHKLPSTPADPSQAVIEGLQRAAVSEAFAVVHGTTVATNALLERRGAKTALLTTQGCRDVLEIARQTRDALYSLSPTPRNPLIPRALRFEAPERLDRDGQVVTPLDVDAVERVLDTLHAQGVESLAVCFLFSFLCPDHEMEVGRRARARGLQVSLSSEIAPEYREYERTSTVCANAFVAPVMARYLGELNTRLSAVGAQRLSVMQSNGGTLRAEEAAEHAIRTVLSGPAGGLVASVRTAREAGFTRIITFDMGGTSTDVALIDGAPLTMRTGEVAGMPLLTPMLDIHTVGAGGGSLARRDVGGGLRVGPESAGADPGPVAYGRGTQLTVTDANTLLGRLPAAVRLAGRMPLDVERVRGAFAPFADALGLTPERSAEGVIAVVNAQMARAIRHISVARGHDPADYTLVAFGGAGGLHACALAEAVGIPRILVPRYPGAFSALGLAWADVRREYVRSLFTRADESGDAVVRTVRDELAARAREEIVREGVARRDVALEAFVEARYVGQSYALRVPLRRGLAHVARAFHRVHRDRYGHADPTQPVEVVAVGMTGIGVTPRPPMSAPSCDRIDPDIGTAPLWCEERWIDCPLYRREGLRPGTTLPGPALLLQDDATTFVAPGWHVRVDEQGNLLLQHR